MSKRIYKRRGFTIVEIAITVVVIGILSGITTVAYRGINTRAKNTAIVSAVEAYLKGIEIYALKNKGFPRFLQVPPLTSYYHSAEGCLGTAENYPPETYSSGQSNAAGQCGRAGWIDHEYFEFFKPYWPKNPKFTSANMIYEERRGIMLFMYGWSDDNYGGNIRYLLHERQPSCPIGKHAGYWWSGDTLCQVEFDGMGTIKPN